jgi:hypothetical protein
MISAAAAPSLSFLKPLKLSYIFGKSGMKKIILPGIEIWIDHLYQLPNYRGMRVLGIDAVRNHNRFFRLEASVRKEDYVA